MFTFFARLIDDVFLVLRDAHPTDNSKSVRSIINNDQLCNLIVKDPNDITVLLTMKERAPSVGSFLQIVWAPTSVAESGWSYLFAPSYA